MQKKPLSVKIFTLKFLLIFEDQCFSLIDSKTLKPNLKAEMEFNFSLFQFIILPNSQNRSREMSLQNYNNTSIFTPAGQLGFYIKFNKFLFKSKRLRFCIKLKILSYILNNEYVFDRPGCLKFKNNNNFIRLGYIFELLNCENSF